ncbi:HAD-IIIC family phosphatase [Tengunoibacter tsumagoiensis]|uniref:Haloacid dehalogenase n=1 Tax=Tengunoibacter tsumagoiensis TaxID=2014871 RepID=A0A402A9N0_9CHLR|nr:HAD-IIIC family phosphatase [Tengunoibacter tsumagoiensis]GCE15661.1 haloacid dehalogenase [Tengunoibacter tsumagoiensis]
MVSESGVIINEKPPKKKSIKCVVWDLDHTLWDGVLLEDGEIHLRQDVVEVIKTLDERGILHSIASKNDAATALARLEAFGIREYFLFPQINWNSKASSIKEIAKALNIGIDTFAFVDDQPFEREEVAFALPEVLCIDALESSSIPALEAMQPRFITQDSRNRRHMYLSDMNRDEAEKTFTGPSDEFLATLNMAFTIAPCTEAELQRAEELTIRTHQLNTTGYTYSYEELKSFITSPRHRLYVSSLDDKYGTYGTIGLALVECEPTFWTVKLLLMSCRVMSRGVGTIMLNYLMQQARAAGVTLRAEFVSNNRNRMMLVTYKFGGFREIMKEGDFTLFEHDLAHITPFPAYVDVIIKE